MADASRPTRARPRPRGRARQLRQQLDELGGDDEPRLRRELRRLRAGGRRAGREPGAGGPLRDQLDDVERALAKLDDGTYGALRGVRRADRPRPASRPCRPPGSASTTRSDAAWLAAAHLVQRFFGSLLPGGPSTADAAGSTTQLLAGRARALAHDVARRPAPRGRRGPTGRAGAGRRGHPPGAGRRAAPRRGQDRVRPRHLRPGDRHAVGRRVAGHDRPRRGASTRGFTRGSGCTSTTPSSAPTCWAWPAATRSPWPGPASTTCPTSSGRSPAEIGQALKDADDD